MTEQTSRIEELALHLYHEGKTMTFDEVRDILTKEGYPSGNGKGVGQMIRGAWNQAKEEGNNGLATEIPHLFHDNNGNFPWE